jgi:hypothetical protein
MGKNSLKLLKKFLRKLPLCKSIFKESTIRAMLLYAYLQDCLMLYLLQNDVLLSGILYQILEHKIYRKWIFDLSSLL